MIASTVSSCKKKNKIVFLEFQRSLFQSNKFFHAIFWILSTGNLVWKYWGINCSIKPKSDYILLRKSGLHFGLVEEIISPFKSKSS